MKSRRKTHGANGEEGSDDRGGASEHGPGTILRSMSTTFIVVYVGAVVLSLTAAHLLKILMPESRIAERIVLPVTNGLEFLDSHWRAIVVLLALPFAAPSAQVLLSQIKKIGPIEFYESVHLESAGIGEKPPHEEAKPSEQGPEAHDGT